MTQHLTATHVTVAELKTKTGHGHKLCMHNFFYVPPTHSMAWLRQNQCYGMVRPNSRGMPQYLAPKKMKLKQDIHVRIIGNLTPILWRDKQDIYMLTNIHNAPTEGKFCDTNGKAIKQQIVVDYSHHVGMGDRIANSYSISCRTWKWTKKLFFHLLDLAILNNFIHLSSCGGEKISHKDF